MCILLSQLIHPSPFRSFSFTIVQGPRYYLNIPGSSGTLFLLLPSRFILLLFSFSFRYINTRILYSSENLQPPERIVAPFSVWPLGNRAPCPTCTLSPSSFWDQTQTLAVSTRWGRCLEFYLYLKSEQGHRQTRSNPDGCGISLLHLTSLSTSFSLLFFLYVQPVYIQVVPATEPSSLFFVLSLTLSPSPADHL